MVKAIRRKKAARTTSKARSRPAARQKAASSASPPRRVRQILSDRVPEPPGPAYSNCLMFGDTVYVAGQTASDGKGGLDGNGTPYGQARQCLLKIRRMLKAAGCTMRDVVKINVYVTNMGMRPDLVRARSEFFSAPMPCSTLVQVVALAEPKLVIEIEAIAVRQTRR